MAAIGSITLSPLPSTHLAGAIAAGEGGELWVGGFGNIWSVKVA